MDLKSQLLGPISGIFVRVIESIINHDFFFKRESDINYL